jgi:hypothetical protein
MLMRFISLEKPPYDFFKFQFLGHRWTMLHITINLISIYEIRFIRYCFRNENSGEPRFPLLELFLATVKISFHKY